MKANNVSRKKKKKKLPLTLGRNGERYFLEPSDNAFMLKQDDFPKT